MDKRYLKTMSMQTTVQNNVRYESNCCIDVKVYPYLHPCPTISPIGNFLLYFGRQIRTCMYPSNDVNMFRKNANLLYQIDSDIDKWGV